MEKETQMLQVMDWACAIADIARRHGQNDFPEMTDLQSPTASAHLCGLTVFFHNHDIMRIKTCDMDLRLIAQTPQTSPSCDISFLPTRTQIADFQSGTLATLALWHSRLLQLSSFFAGSSAALSPRDPIARAA